MRLTYSHIYSYENKHNSVGGSASNNLKKVILKLFVSYLFILIKMISKHFDIILTVPS